jgi:hypothetical protein
MAPSEMRRHERRTRLYWNSQSDVWIYCYLVSALHTFSRLYYIRLSPINFLLSQVPLLFLLVQLYY